MLEITNIKPFIEKKDEEVKIQIFTDSLVSYLKSEFEKAKNAKIPIENEMIESLRQRNSEYKPDKLASMKALFGQDYDPPFIPITLIKCISAEAWLKDIILGSNETPFIIKPTPKPNLSDEDFQQVIDETTTNIIKNAAMGAYPDIETMLNESKRTLNSILNVKIKEIVDKRTDELTKIIDDQLVEGNWYEAIDEFISDVVTFKAGFIKGPTFKKKRKIIKTATGFEIKETLIPFFKRVSPFDIYPEPDASDIEDGYIFERIFFTKNDLYDFYSLSGVNKEYLTKVLTEYSNGFITQQFIDQERKDLENKDISYLSNRIEGLEFWGYVDGQLLIDWGFDDPNVVIDPVKPYQINAIIIGDYVIRAILNPDPLGRKPYFKASFMNINGSFWGKGIPEVIKDLQAACNSVARSILLNSAYASGPVVEVNEDRLSNGISPYLHPYKVYIVTNSQMLESPVVRFNQAQLVADRLLAVYNIFSKLADEASVPSYAYGDPDLSGAGRTLGGLRLLYSGASRNIKNVVKNIDSNIIEKSIELLYSYNIVYNLIEDIPDSEIIAKGSTYLMIREQQIRDMIELLGITMNEIDSQYINRKKLIEAIIKGKGLDVTEILIDNGLASMGIPQPISSKLNIEALKKASPTAYNSMTGGSLPNIDKDVDKTPTQ
jgi:hypothetical protein